MNPLDLRGPEFLLFYLVYGVAVLAGLAWWRRRAEAVGDVRVKLSDPYLIACLRGGRDEALQVAVLSLVDRGLLDVRGDGLVASRGVTPDSVRRPIEKDLLAMFAEEQAAHRLFDANAAGAATLELERTLAQEGLLAGPEHQRQRQGRVLLGLGLLLGLAFLKLMVAFARGRSNVLLLIVLALVFTVLALRVSYTRRTAKGDAVLADLRTLFAGLRRRAAGLRRGGATSEVVLLAAVFGLSVLPWAQWAELRALFERAPAHVSATDASGGGGSHGTTTCGSSCGSSCGGGCGGGCGGCGS